MSFGLVTPRRSLAAVLLIVLATPAFGETSFYPQGDPILPNGLDMDDDWIFGEPGEDDLVCDSVGGEWKGNAYHEDVDGDGVREEQIFVDAQKGSDSPQCGAPGSPCASIAFAEKRVDDGLSDNAEPIVCARGVFAERMHMPLSGLATTKVKTQRPERNELTDFFYPKDPAMLVGWDTDDDGIYPPLDPDDEFILDEHEGFQFVPDAVNGGDYWEVAHFRARKSGSATKQRGGFYGQRRNETDYVSYTYFHDGWLEKTNHQKCHSTGNMVWNFFTLYVEYQAAERIRATDVYGYVNRGGARGKYMRFSDWSLTARTRGANGRDPNVADHMGNRCNTGEEPHDVSPGATGGGSIMRVWAYGREPLKGYEWINSRFEYVGSDAPLTGRNGGFTGGIMLTCLAETTFSGNLLVNISELPALTTGDGICNPGNSPGMRYTTNMYRNHNTIRVTDASLMEPRFWTTSFAILKGNHSPHKGHDGIEGVLTFNHNLIDYSLLPESKGHKLSSLVALNPSKNVDYSRARFEIVGNRVLAKSMRHDWGLLLEMNTDGPMARPASLLIKDNVISNPFGAGGKGDLILDATIPLDMLTEDSGGNQVYGCGAPPPVRSILDCTANPKVELPELPPGLPASLGGPEASDEP